MRISPLAASCTIAGTRPCIFPKSICISHLNPFSPQRHTDTGKGRKNTRLLLDSFGFPCASVVKRVLETKSPLNSSLSGPSILVCCYLSPTPPPSRRARDGGGDGADSSWNL